MFWKVSVPCQTFTFSFTCHIYTIFYFILVRHYKNYKGPISLNMIYKWELELKLSNCRIKKLFWCCVNGWKNGKSSGCISKSTFITWKENLETGCYYITTYFMEFLQLWGCTPLWSKKALEKSVILSIHWYNTVLLKTTFLMV